MIIKMEKPYINLVRNKFFNSDLLENIFLKIGTIVCNCRLIYLDTTVCRPSNRPPKNP